MPRTPPPGSSPSQQRPIVAELGRPETPEETAARKAEASRRHRSNQTALNLVVALAASLAVMLLLVLVVVRPEPAPREPIDYQAVASNAQSSVEETLASPQLPDGWSANSAKVETGADGITSWYIGFITPKNQFIALRQGIDANPTWLAAQLEFSRPSGSTNIDGLNWQLHDNRDASEDPGNLAYVMTTEVDDSTFVLFGSAADAEFETLALSLSAQLSEAGQ